MSLVGDAKAPAPVAAEGVAGDITGLGDAPTRPFEGDTGTAVRGDGDDADADAGDFCADVGDGRSSDNAAMRPLALR